MKYFLPIIFSLLLASCSNSDQPAPESSSQPAARDTSTAPPTTSGTPVHNNPASLPDTLRAGTHPISLQWIGWNKPGEATITPDSAGWYTISGSQLSEDREYLNIEGKIRRVSGKELEFTGIVETRVRMNNGGKPCIKKGKQRFFAKGARTYYRLQNMENCQGGNLLDYVDIYPGTSSL